MKVLFLIHDYVIDPLGIGYLASALKKAGHEVSIFKTKNDSAKVAVEAFNPDVLAYSCTTGWHKYYIQLNRDLKERFPDKISIFGGSHATYFPEMVKEEGVDFVIRGEAETELKGGVINTGKLEQDLDKIEFPDRDLLYSYPENRDNPIKNVITSRGCPYNCGYCYNNLYRSLYKGQKWVRQRSFKNVVEECEGLKIYPLKFIFFEDDCFALNMEWLAGFSSLYRKKINIPFHCQVRVEMINKERMALLKHAGCTGITFAIESGNEKIRNKMLGRNFTNDATLKAVDILRECGLKFRMENMIGLPGETLKNAIQTLDFNIKCRPQMGWCSLLQPYPKTALGSLCEQLALYDGNPDNIGRDFFSKSPIKIDRKREFSNLQKIFTIVVKFKWLRIFVPLIIKLPEFKFMDRVNTKFRHWLYDTKMYK